LVVPILCRLQIRYGLGDRTPDSKDWLGYNTMDDGTTELLSRQQPWQWCDKKNLGNQDSHLAIAEPKGAAV